MEKWYWELLAGITAAVVYYVLRFSPNASVKVPNPKPFGAYFLSERRALFQGVVTFLIAWSLWNYAAAWLLGVARELVESLRATTFGVPPMNVAVAAVLGFASKKLCDVFPRIAEVIVSRLKRIFA